MQDFEEAASFEFTERVICWCEVFCFYKNRFNMVVLCHVPDIGRVPLHSVLYRRALCYCAVINCVIMSHVGVLQWLKRWCMLF